MPHIIILTQQTAENQTRHYSEYPSLPKAMDAICRMFEAHLKQLNPTKRKITYDISQLFQFLDNFHDLAALTFDSETGGYLPQNRNWIKQQVLAQLKRQAGQ